MEIKTNVKAGEVAGSGGAATVASNPIYKPAGSQGNNPLNG